MDELHVVPGVLRAPPSASFAAGRPAGLALRDVLVTRDELRALMAGLLVSREPRLGRDRSDVWVRDNAATLGRRYTSELARTYSS